MPRIPVLTAAARGSQALAPDELEGVKQSLRALALPMSGAANASSCTCK